MSCRRLFPLFLASAVGTGCGLGFGPASTLSLPGTLPVTVSCLAGLVGGGDGCVAPEPASCPAGSAAFFGETGCTPVGATCPQGFVKDPSGFGCLEAHAGAACTGASRESPTSAGCVPIGDCAAPFPPADATFFVDASFTTTDATHFKTIAAAAHRARAGAVIAVEAGTYAEPIVDPIDSVTVVGRCAEQVKLTGTGGNQVGLYVVVPGLVVRGITVSGHVVGVFAASGDLTLEDSVVEGNFSAGVFARDGSSLTVRRSRLRHEVPARR